MKFKTLNEGHRPCLIQTEFKNGFNDIKTPLCIYYSDISDAFEVLKEKYNRDLERDLKWMKAHGYEKPEVYEFSCNIAFLKEGEGLSFKTALYTNEYLKIGKEEIKLK